MRGRSLVLLAFAALLVALPTAALGGATHRTANSTTFADSTGEDPEAPDIVSIVVSNDDAGMITFQINISNRPALTPDMFVLIFLDTDQNTATGDTSSFGADYAIELDPGFVTLFQWNGSDYVSSASQTSLVYSYAATGPTIKISAADLGRTKAFKFLVIAASGATLDPSGNPDFSKIHLDFAPDAGHGLFPYQVLTKLVLTVTAFTTGPKPAKAGRPFSASLAATQNDTGGPVESGTVSCGATIAGRRLVATTRALANGVASCVWRIPKTAKGKTLRGTIVLNVQGVRVSRTFSAKIS